MKLHLVIEVRNLQTATNIASDMQHTTLPRYGSEARIVGVSVE